MECEIWGGKMTIVTCTLVVFVNIGFNIASQVQWDGKVLKQNADNYLVDFSKEAKKHPKVINQDSYKHKLVNKKDCI